MGNIQCYSLEKTKSSKPHRKSHPSRETIIQEAFSNQNPQKSLTIININQCIIKNETMIFTDRNSLIYNSSDIAKANLIGKGRFSSIYLGLSKTTGKLVIIKVLNRLSPEKKNSILQTLAFLFQLQHINIVKAIRVADSNVKNKTDSGLILYYEYSNGITLENIIKQFGELNEKTIQIYVKQIFEGLAYLHSQGFVHKNLKASNILVEGNSMIKISDVLIDNIVLGMNQEIAEAMLNYPQIQYSIPPFFLQNIERDIDSSYDFWCLGCLMIEMATGKNPWAHYSFNQQEFFDFIQSVQIKPLIPEHLSDACKSFISLLFDESQTSRSDIYKKLSEHDYLNSFATSVALFPKVSEINFDQQKCLGAVLKNHNVIDAFRGTSSFVFSLSGSCSNSLSNNASNIYNNRLSTGKEMFPSSEKKKIISFINKSTIREEEGYAIQKIEGICYISSNDCNSVS